MAKKKSVKEAPKNTLYLQYTEDSRGGEKEDPDDRWSCRADTHTTFNTQSVSLEKRTLARNHVMEVDFVPREGQIVDLVIVRYKTGDTFGSKYGEWCIAGVYDSPKDAELAVTQIREGTFDDNISYMWTGYFERLESVHVVPHRIIK